MLESLAETEEMHPAALLPPTPTPTPINRTLWVANRQGTQCGPERGRDEIPGVGKG